MLAAQSFSGSRSIDYSLHQGPLHGLRGCPQPLRAATAKHGRAGASGGGGQVHQAGVHHKAYGGWSVWCDFVFDHRLLQTFHSVRPVIVCAEGVFWCFLWLASGLAAGRFERMSVTGNLSVAALDSIFPGLEKGPGRPKGKGGQEPLSDADPSFRLMKARPIRTSSRELYQTRSIKNPFADGKSCQCERYPQVDHRGQTTFFSIAAVHIICNNM